MEPEYHSCAMCRADVLELPDETAVNRSLPDWLRSMAEKGFRCGACGAVVCTQCMIRLSLNPMGPAESHALDSFLGKDRLGSGVDPNTVCALCLRLESDEASCPKCQTKCIGYAGKELRDQRRSRLEAEKRKREAARLAEEERVREVKLKRRLYNQCINCGQPLGFIDRLVKRTQHPACKTFRG